MYKNIEDVVGDSLMMEGLRIGDSRAFKPYAQTMGDLYEKLYGRAPDDITMATYGHVLRNFAEKLNILKESTTQSSMPFLQDYGFELITALMPGLIANDQFTIQPARFKNYSIFFQDFEYQTTKNQTTAGTGAITALTADDIDENYTLDAEVDRVIGNGDGSTAVFSLAPGAGFVPIVVGSVQVTSVDTGDNPLAAVDDGVGGFTGDVTGTNTINYVTGAITVTFNANVKNGTDVLLDYQYVGEGSTTNAPEYGMTISEITGVATERRLRYNFSIESQFSYRQQFGRSMDADLMAASVAQVRKEIDQTLTLFANTSAKVQTGANASAGSVIFDRTPDTGVQYFYWREQFIDTLNAAGNLIFKATGVGVGNIATGGINFKQVLETIGPRFQPSGITGVKGSHFIGTLDGGKIRCYVEPAMLDNEFYVTYKGGPLEVGLSYNPWMPLFASEPHMLDNGKLHRYLITASGKKLVNPKMFVQGTLTQS